jgi:hypothetical protein
MSNVDTLERVEQTLEPVLDMGSGDGELPQHEVVQTTEADMPDLHIPAKSFLRFVGEKLLMRPPEVPNTGNHFLGHNVKEWTMYASSEQNQG